MAWRHDESYAYMLAYSLNDSYLAESLIVIKDPYVTRTSDVAGDPDIWNLHDQITENTEVLPSNTLFGHPYKST